MTLKQSAEQDFLNKLAHHCVPLLYSTKLSSHVMCPDKTLARNRKNRHYLFIFFHYSLKICTQPTLSAVCVCACIMMPICKDQTLHSGSTLGIDLRREESELIAVVNQQWDREKSTLKLFTLTLSKSLTYAGNMGESRIKLKTKSMSSI